MKASIFQIQKKCPQDQSKNYLATSIFLTKICILLAIQHCARKLRSCYFCCRPNLKSKWLSWPRIWLSILHLSSQPRSYSTQSKSSKSRISKSNTAFTFTCNSCSPAFSTATTSKTQPFSGQPFGLAQISIC